MLISKKHSVRWRVTTVLVATALVTLLGVVIPCVGASRGWWGWPESSSWYGVLLGLVGGLIVLFEMALYPRKALRRYKGFPAVLWSQKLWLRAHVVLGLLCFPIIMVHAGYGFGGPVSRVTMILFLLTIASGVWGLVVQQWLPRKLLDEIPEEAVASQIDDVAGAFVGRVGAGGRDRTGEVFKLVEPLIREAPEVGEKVGAYAADHWVTAVHAKPLVTGQATRDLEAFLDAELIPYLEAGDDSRANLITRSESERRFARLRESLPVEALPTIDALEEMADRRRQWDAQFRINWWLHCWIPVHVLVSTAMTGLMLVHAVRALKYW